MLTLPIAMMDLEPRQVLAYSVLLLIPALYFLLRLPSSQLGHIPTVGGPSTPLFSYLGSFRFFVRGVSILQEGYTKHKGHLFKYNDWYSWTVAVTTAQQIDEVRKAPDDVLSFLETGLETVQGDYTLGRAVHENPYHISLVRSQLTRSLSAIFPQMMDEISTAFEDTIPTPQKHGDWVKVHPRDVITQRGVKFLGPLITERSRLAAELGDEWKDKPNDMLQWCIDSGVGEAIPDLVMRILTINMAAIHSSSITFTHAIFHLATNPHFIQPIREEVDELIQKEGWSKETLGKMHKVDSFLREAMRMDGLAAVSLDRVALKDFTFSDGTIIPAGTRLAAPARAIHRDDELYPNALTFDPWRFSNMRDKTEQGAHNFAVNTSAEFMIFGHGKHACPGRFFVVNEMKAMLAYIAVNYDVKMADDSADMPPSMYFGRAIVPNGTAEVAFRKRQH
ncbi:uncharacterized protein FIBRA_08043 [Fibroporia radiculosa]|uniref:Cytochrome P450 n=1 Tax=Fibroporia radiculosa TaxID=599839 RepID=J4H4Y7_9APHY|nr:uncharacterized protein FIBRA_08043 [Fibroporia radiculosa]CCM05809.1 predicted protein [Fibroporia radiculosa]